MCQASLSITNSRSLLKLMPIESVTASNHLILCRPLLLPPLIFPSIRVFSNQSVFPIRWPKFGASASSEYLGPISFRVDWLDLLAVQRDLKSLLQHYSSKAPILRHSAFFTVQLSHLYMTTGKTIALTRWTFVGKVVSLLLNMLSRLAITFLPRSKCPLISWLQSPSAVILEPRKIKSDTVSTVSTVSPSSQSKDFPGAPVVKNPASNAGDESLIPDGGTKILHAPGEQSPQATTRESPLTAMKIQHSQNRKQVNRQVQIQGVKKQIPPLKGS